MSPPACANVVVCPRKSQNGPEWFEVEPYATFERRLSTYLGTQPKSRQRASSCEIEDARVCGPAGQEVIGMVDNVAAWRIHLGECAEKCAYVQAIVGAILKLSVFPDDREVGDELLATGLARMADHPKEGSF
jgi:hypothetical protein